MECVKAKFLSKMDSAIIKTVIAVQRLSTAALRKVLFHFTYLLYVITAIVESSRSENCKY